MTAALTLTNAPTAALTAAMLGFFVWLAFLVYCLCDPHWRPDWRALAVFLAITTLCPAALTALLVLLTQ